MSNFSFVQPKNIYRKRTIPLSKNTLFWAVIRESTGDVSTLIFQSEIHVVKKPRSQAAHSFACETKGRDPEIEVGEKQQGPSVLSLIGIGKILGTS